jgi:hypothetical protein
MRRRCARVRYAAGAREAGQGRGRGRQAAGRSGGGGGRQDGGRDGCASCSAQGRRSPGVGGSRKKYHLACPRPCLFSVYTRVHGFHRFLAWRDFPSPHAEQTRDLEPRPHPPLPQPAYPSLRHGRLHLPLPPCLMARRRACSLQLGPRERQHANFLRPPVDSHWPPRPRRRCLCSTSDTQNMSSSPSSTNLMADASWTHSSAKNLHSRASKFALAS